MTITQPKNVASKCFAGSDGGNEIVETSVVGFDGDTPGCGFGILGAEKDTFAFLFATFFHNLV
jgi:hypothetical protein